jgi:GNAT superfamily N-acetyltransferase
MTNPQIDLRPYRSEPALDATLARIGYAAVTGWPDQRPITADLVASRLAPPTDTADTILATIADAGHVIAWVALRPAPPTGTARLWGPVVQPGYQTLGLGQQLLATITATEAFQQDRGRLTTAEIPCRRRSAREFFANAGWQPAGTASLLRRTPAREPQLGAATDVDPRISTLADNNGNRELPRSIARLYALDRADEGLAVAAATLRRWQGDRRYRPDHLLVAATPSGSLAGVCLLYPLAHATTDEPPEVLLADLLTDPEHDPLITTARLLDASIAHTAKHHPDATLRAITTNDFLAAALARRGAELADFVIYYRPV